MSITASEARKALFPLIKKINDDHEAIEIVSKHGNAVLVSAEGYAALRAGSYLLRSPANARRLLNASAAARSGRPVASPSGVKAPCSALPSVGRWVTEG
ncbi:type II toxin-antitoxin system Phd/YefM family antitoxin [Streptomyces sp. NPDC058307]|uniref:type II toxin-antitoxin system Phd/YefM family antitoxin n=1 Tax=Streptomyces sp. NPDC058307 TaxID=3346439 RepID=UPI0036E24E72